MLKHLLRHLHRTAGHAVQLGYPSPLPYGIRYRTVPYVNYFCHRTMYTVYRRIPYGDRTVPVDFLLSPYGFGCPKYSTPKTSHRVHCTALHASSTCETRATQTVHAQYTPVQPTVHTHCSAARSTVYPHSTAQYSQQNMHTAERYNLKYTARAAQCSTT